MYRHSILTKWGWVLLCLRLGIPVLLGIGAVTHGDWIVGVALGGGAMYITARSLHLDRRIRRHGMGDPITLPPGSAAERMRKWLRGITVAGITIGALGALIFSILAVASHGWLTTVFWTFAVIFVMTIPAVVVSTARTRSQLFVREPQP